MESVSFELHPAYGAIPRDGEIVQIGDVLGLSTDMREVVTAPVPGRVRLIAGKEEPRRSLLIQIFPDAPT